MDFKRTICFVLCFLSSIANSVVAEDQAKEAKAPITLKEMQERGVVGALGLKFGTLVNIKCLIIENNSRAKAHDGEPYFYRVIEMDGKKIEKPIVYSYRQVAFEEKGNRELRIGETIQLRGYETGQFAGIPDDVYKEEYGNQGPAMQVGHYFVTQFVGKEIGEEPLPLRPK